MSEELLELERQRYKMQIEMERLNTEISKLEKKKGELKNSLFLLNAQIDFEIRGEKCDLQ